MQSSVRLWPEFELVQCDDADIIETEVDVFPAIVVIEGDGDELDDSKAKGNGDGVGDLQCGEGDETNKPAGRDGALRGLEEAGELVAASNEEAESEG